MQPCPLSGGPVLRCTARPELVADQYFLTVEYVACDYAFYRRRAANRYEAVIKVNHKRLRLGDIRHDHSFFDDKTVV